MKEFKSFTDFPLWVEMALFPLVWVLMIFKILIYIPIAVIAWINKQMERYE